MHQCYFTTSMQYILRIHNTQLFFFYVNFALPTGACVHGQEIEYLSVCFLDLNSLLNGKTNRN